MYGIYDNGEQIMTFAAPMSLSSNQPYSISDSLSLKRSSVRRTAQRWELETAMVPEVDTANLLFAHVVQKGYSTSFDVNVPQNRGAAAATIESTTQPSASGSANSNQVNVSNSNGTIPVGCLVRMQGGTKIYMVTSTRAGNGAMSVYPALLAQTSGSFEYLDDVMMPCYYDTSTVTGMAYTDGVLMDLGTIKLIEAL